MDIIELIEHLTEHLGDPKVHRHTTKSGRTFDAVCWYVDVDVFAKVVMSVLCAAVNSSISRMPHAPKVDVTIYRDVEVLS